MDDNAPKETPDKIKVGWFTFSCCEDNTVIMTEVMNDHWQEWKKMFDFKHARVLQSHNEMGEFDVAFIEGALASPDHVEKLKEIRSQSKVLVAVGACACIGMPSAQRNNFTDEQRAEVAFLIEKFKMSDNVQKVSDVVKVDYEVPGCPMSPDDFLAKVTLVVKELQSAKE